MFCTNCGKELPEGTKVCDACNTPLDDIPVQEFFSPPYAEQMYPNGQPNIVNNFYQQPRQPVSVLGWIGRSLIACIPFVGAIIYLVMLFIWAGDKTKEESFNNWAKAQLILMAIALGLALIIAVILLVIAISAATSVSTGYGTIY